MGLHGFLLFCFCISVYADPGDWALLTSAPTARYDAGLAIVGDEIFAAAGSNGAVMATHEKYDISQDAWLTVRSLPTALSYPATVAVDDQIFSCGGDTPTGRVASTYKYTVTSDVWTAVTLMPSARSHAAHAKFGNKIHVAGGYTVTAVHEAYDVAADTWTTMQSVPVAMMGSGGCADNNYMYLIGGYDTTYFTTVYKYRFSDDLWSQAPGRPGSRGYSAVAISFTTLFAVGGNASPTDLRVSTAHEYDTLADTWVAINPLPSGVSNFKGVTFGEVGVTYVFVFGGSAPAASSALSRVEAPYISELSIQGDPVITTFTGVVDHLDLFPGVFNIFSTPNIIVNALVLDSPHLPPSENMVIVGVALMTKSDLLEVVYCDVDSCFSSSHPLECINNGMAVTLDGFLFQIKTNTIRVIDPLGVVVSSELSFLNLHIRSDSARSSSFGGLLGDVENLGFAGVRSKLATGQYSVDGGVFDVCVPSAEGPVSRYCADVEKVVALSS